MKQVEEYHLRDRRTVLRSTAGESHSGHEIEDIIPQKKQASDGVSAERQAQLVDPC